MKILSISSVFPNPSEPGLGVFVRARLQAMADRAEIKVVAPVPLLDYSRLRSRRAVAIPSRRVDGALEVLHPRWFYPPGGSVVNALCLWAGLVPHLIRVRRNFRFDWIDSHFAFPEGIAAALLAQSFHVPFSVTLRGNETMHAGRSKAIRMLMRWAFRRARCIITVSESLRQFAISLGADPLTTRTVPNGVDHSIFYPRDRDACRRALGVRHGQKVIVSAGTLIERKGHHHVMKALKSLVVEGIDAHLLIVGGAGREGDFSSRLERMPAELGIGDRVRLVGHVSPDAMAEVLSSADLFCLASSREGWPNVVHEAMACGTPVVTTNVGGTPEMVPLPLYGTVVPPGDQPALQQAIGAALEIDWNRDAIRAWAHARSWTQVANEVLELLQTPDGARL